MPYRTHTLENIIKCHVILSIFMLNKTSMPWTNQVARLANDFLWYSSTKYTNHTVYNKSKNFIPLIDVKQLWVSLNSGDFSSFTYHDLLFPNQKVIYAFVNPSHRKLYVGQTKNVVARFTQHLRESWLNKVISKKTDRFHSYMANNNYGSWCMIPIFLPTETKTDVDKTERRMIRFFGDSTLNSTHVISARRFNFSTRSSGKHVSKSCLQHNRNRPKQTKRLIPFSTQRFTLTKQQNDSSNMILSTHHDLCKILALEQVKNCRESHKITLKVTGNLSINTNWQTVRMLYGKTVVKNTSTNALCSLSSCIRLLKKGTCPPINIVACNVWNDVNSYDTLKTLGTSTEHVAKRMCRHMSFETLFSLRKKISLLRTRRVRELAQVHLDKYLKKRFGVKFNAPLTMKVAFSPSLSKHDIHTQALRMINNLSIPKFFASHLTKQLRIVFTKRQSIDSILCNHRSFARTYGSFLCDDPPRSCVCHQYPNLPRVDGHILFKGNESNNEKIYDVCRHNAKNVVLPHRFDTKNDITRAFCVLNENLSKSFNSSVANISNTIKQLSIEDLVDASLMNQSDRKSSMSSAVYSLPSTHTVKKLKKNLSGLVISPLDKNTGSLCFCCPVHYDRSLRKSYTKNDCYTKVATSTKRILKSWEKHYAEKNYDRFYNYPSANKVAIPNAYTLFKNKDLLKYRPITSYSSHPYKKLLNATARGLNFILENADIAHFNLPNICKFKDIINGFNNDLSNHDYKFKCIAGDLSNMYTYLDHTSIRKAVRWLLYDTKKSKTRDRKVISVPTCKSDKSIHFGRSTLTSEARFDLSYEDIIDIMNFDLNNSVFTIGTFTGKQTCGIPMGSPLSPALAVIVCAYYENKVFKKIKDLGWTNKLMGTRYMDDVLGFITHDGSKESIHRANCIYGWVKYGYHHLMDLECEDTTIDFKFLSCHVNALSGSPISISYYNKNSESLAADSSQTILTFQHYGSIAPKMQKASVVISSLYRLDMNSMNLMDLAASVRDLFYELSTLQYPYKVLVNALERACSNTRLRYSTIAYLLT